MNLRKSNFEVLRIVSILLIIIFHCSYHSGLAFMGRLNPSMFTVKVFWMFGELGVNLFMLISGYFGVKSTFKWKKVGLLIAELYFYHFLTIGFGVYKNIYFIEGAGDILELLLPFMTDHYWFFTAYIIVYIFSPYLNVLINNLDKGEAKGLVLSLLTIFCIIPTVYGAMFNNTEGFLYYNRMIWLVVVYTLGAYIRLHSPKVLSTAKKSIIGFVATFAFIVASIFAIDRLPDFFGSIGIKEEAFFWQPNTVPMILLSVFLFGIFEKIAIPNNKIINTIASTTLGIYLMHDGILRQWLWHTAFRASQKQYTNDIVPYILKTAFIVFAVGVVIDLIRQVFEKLIFKKLPDYIISKHVDNNTK